MRCVRILPVFAASAAFVACSNEARDPAEYATKISSGFAEALDTPPDSGLCDGDLPHLPDASEPETSEPDASQPEAPDAGVVETPPVQ
jgi:hypothetical protein